MTIKIYRNENGTHRVYGKLPERQKAMKKPIPVSVYQMPEPFEVETLEGTMQGKAGDWLMVGVRGEMYPCDAGVFAESYDLVEVVQR